MIDTLNRSIEGSESDDADMGRYVKAADAIREAFGCAVIVIHHCGVDGSRPRGHTSLTGAADAQLAVKRNAAGQVVATVEWMKDGPEGDEIVSTLKVVEVATDEDGEPVTSCVIEMADGERPVKASGRKVPPSARAAFDLLRKAIEAEGKVPPASNHIPANVMAVQREQWRRYCYAGLVSEADNADAKRRAFNRAAKALENAGVIVSWDDWVWAPGT